MRIRSADQLSVSYLGGRLIRYASTNQMKKASSIFALFLLGAVLGLPMGIYLVQHKFIDSEKAIGMWSEEVFFDGFAKKEFIYADPRSAREALQYAIKIHNEMRSKSVLWGPPEKSDLAWCYAELNLDCVLQSLSRA